MIFRKVPNDSTNTYTITFFKKNGPIPGLFFCLFLSFQHVTAEIQIQMDKSIGCVLGIRTRGGRMEDTDESTELRRHSHTIKFYT